MRTIRALTIAATVVAAIPTLASAQRGHPFKDAWFWGVKGGGFTLADTAQAYRQAGLVGFDWLITRTHGGLYVSATKAFMTQQAFVFRDPTTADSGMRVVDIKGLRKLDMALVGFPGEHIVFHPYVGVGMTLVDVSDAQPRGPFANSDQLSFADQQIQNGRSGFTPFFIAGAQWRVRYVSVFAQGTMNPAQKNFILYNGRPYNFSYELGLRYNVGTSIDRNR